MARSPRPEYAQQVSAGEGNPESEDLPWPERSAGVLLHPASLPGRFGIGDIGPEAHRFAELLSRSGQRLWQEMPLGPTGPGNSPYAARSSFAGSPLLISPEMLAADGLAEAADLEGAPPSPGDRVDFDAVERWKEGLFRRAFERFDRGCAPGANEFFARSAGWLQDYALYMAVRSRAARSWLEWPPELASRDPRALAGARDRLREEVAYHEFLQWAFWRQWHGLKEHCTRLGVRIFGDIPIFVALDSADVWANQWIFKLGPGGRPEVVAGVPPDAFAATGQRWGNPHYRWDVLKDDGYGWWIERLRHTLGLVDLLRIDHFRGFEAAWEVPAQEETAMNGRWVPGPGRDFFDKAEEALGKLPLVIEDLGVITRKVRALRDSLGYPGMKVLQFAFGDDSRNPYLPHNYAANSVVYTGTHDNDTTAGWYASLAPGERDRLHHYVATDGSDIVSDLIRVAYASVAEMAVVPMQDVLRLGSEARMNVPGQAMGNWGWRFRAEQIDEGRMTWLRDLAVTYGRVPGAKG
ncbi:MAG: 4-alpha-glucanotransferase [Dehalococcoidia bacterium]|nr:4-alpha-glucanotransferase [Dehalococcoidia bacterium]